MAQKTAMSLKNKAMSDLNAGKLQQALKKAQLGVKKFPQDPDYRAIAGFVLVKMERYKQSIPHFAEASRARPDDPQFAENLANALVRTGQLSRALTYAEQKLERFPNNTELQRVIEEIGMKGDNWRQMIEYTTKRLTVEPDNPTFLTIRSRALGKIGFTEESTRDIERAYELEPENEEIAFRRALNLHRTGNAAECARILAHILTENDCHAHALLVLSTLAGENQQPDLSKKVESAIAKSDSASVELEFAKAHLIAKRDGLEAALPQYARANAAQYDANRFEPNAEAEKLDRIRNIVPTGDVRPASEPKDGPLPIFVIGQPRSGTTLMEMMLSAAPDIAGCGELRIAGDLSHPLIEDGRAFTPEAASHFAATFRELMPPLPDGSTAFVDKMPRNYENVGFLLTAFPNAKVINMMRDPRDVGLSKWIRYFPAPGMRYSSHFGAIAQTANIYRQYMEHWDKVFGSRILTVRYEHLVSDPKTCSMDVAGFCGVEWSESMLHPEQNKKHVNTASIDQVRNKISTKSIGSWRSVASHLKPMIDGFDPKLWPEYDFS